MEKKAGILDQPRDTLDFSIWTPDRKLRPDIRRIMIDRIYDLMGPDRVKAMYLIGSMTGYKYKPTSDIDINVLVDPFDKSIGKAKLTRPINEQNIGDTEHPVNYFVQPYDPDRTWQNSRYGVYSILEDRWEVDPPPREGIRNPEDQYRDDLTHGVWMGHKFDRLVKEFHKDLLALKQLKELSRSGKWMHSWYFDKKIKEVNEDFQGLIKFVKLVGNNRKLRYSLGWGIPRNTTANVVYKHISKGPHRDFFHKLEPMSINAKIQA